MKPRTEHVKRKYGKPRTVGANAYSKYGCRCENCTRAWAKKRRPIQAAARARKRREQIARLEEIDRLRAELDRLRGENDG